MANDEDSLIYNDQIVELLSISIHKGEASLKHVPDLMRDLIKQKRWKKRKIRRTGQVTEFKNFVEFVETQPLEGLGTSINVIQSLCSETPDVLRMLDAEIIETTTDLVGYPFLVKFLEKDNPELAE
ncbi:MAG: hypothetical protein AAF846_29245, partial [Chloroflexota bacterium]